MDNVEKYNLIVKIKELILDTDIEKDIHKINPKRISLNASKVLKLIYENPKLNDFFQKKVQEYEELYKDKNKYREALNLRKEQIKPHIPEEYTNSVHIYDNDFIIYLDDSKKHTIRKIISDTFSWIEIIGTVSVFDFTTSIINVISGVNINTIRDKNDNLLFGTFDKDNYRRQIASLYDYGYLHTWESLSAISMLYSFNTALYLLISYRKVLNDMLNFVYEQNLTEKQKQEQKKLIELARQNKKKKFKLSYNNETNNYYINGELLKLTDAEIDTMKEITKPINQQNHSEKRNHSSRSSHINKKINTLLGTKNVHYIISCRNRFFILDEKQIKFS